MVLQTRLRAANLARAGEKDEHVPVGSGVLDFGRILDPLETATLSLEVFTPSYEYVATSANTLRRQVDGLEEV